MHSRFPHISVETVPQIMEYEIPDICSLASIFKTILNANDTLTIFPDEHVIVFNVSQYYHRSKSEQFSPVRK